MNRDMSALLEVLEVLGVADEAVSIHIHARRHRHVALGWGWCSHWRPVRRQVVTLRPWDALVLGGGQGCSCGCRCFLDCTGVVVLVACEGRTTGEGLLAIRKGALVRPLARVRAPVTSQGGAVAEFLSKVSDRAFRAGGGFAYLGAGLAVMWLLASVRPLVDGQGRPLNESLAAVFEVAEVRLVAAVDTL